MTRNFCCLQNERNQVLTSFGVVRLVRFTIYEIKHHNRFRSIQHETDAKALWEGDVIAFSFLQVSVGAENN